jgi:acetyl-CoA C-acetyltransferase
MPTYRHAPHRDQDVVICGAARTPFGKFGGALRDESIPALASAAATEALTRAGVTPSDVDEFALGVNLPGSDRSLGRQAALRAAIPDDRNAYTVDRACCSSLTALSMITRSIRLGEAVVGVAGGAENLSKVPYFLEDMRWGMPVGDVVLKDQLVISCPHTHVPRAVQAADEALAFGVDRVQQDEWALRSQQRHAEAEAAGHLDTERFAVQLPSGESITADESPRPLTSLGTLSALPTVYGSATVTAGNAPGLSTGASSVVLMTRAEARRRAVEPVATVVATAMASGAPAGIASIPARAAQLVLKKADLQLADMHLIEINEAFAAVPLVSALVLADGVPGAATSLHERINVNGGAIAVGHPTGATGARLVMTSANELRRRNGGYALVTICGGIGEAEAVVIRVD